MRPQRVDGGAEPAVVALQEPFLENRPELAAEPRGSRAANSRWPSSPALRTASSLSCSSTRRSKRTVSGSAAISPRAFTAAARSREGPEGKRPFKAGTAAADHVLPGHGSLSR